jgi:hypothetical protein
VEEKTKRRKKKLIAGPILMGIGIPGLVFGIILALLATGKDPDKGVPLFNFGCFLFVAALISVIVGAILFGTGLSEESKRRKSFDAHGSNSDYNKPVKKSRL